MNSQKSLKGFPKTVSRFNEERFRHVRIYFAFLYTKSITIVGPYLNFSLHVLYYL